MEITKKPGAGLGKMQKRILNLIIENDGLTYKNIAEQVYGKVDNYNVGRIYNACSSLRKRGYPVYLVEDGGMVKLIESKTDYPYF